MRGISRVTIAGNLTKDPELINLDNATLCRLSVAVGLPSKKDGEWTEEAHFFDVTVWGGQGENCAKFLTKGRQVTIDGTLIQRRWEADDGAKRSKVEIKAYQVVFGSSPKSGSGNEAENAPF